MRSDTLYAHGALMYNTPHMHTLLGDGTTTTTLPLNPAVLPAVFRCGEYVRDASVCVSVYARTRQTLALPRFGISSERSLRLVCEFPPDSTVLRPPQPAAPFVAAPVVAVPLLVSSCVSCVGVCSRLRWRVRRIVARVRRERFVRVLMRRALSTGLNVK